MAGTIALLGALTSLLASLGTILKLISHIRQPAAQAHGQKISRRARKGQPPAGPQPLSAAPGGAQGTPGADSSRPA